MCATDILGKLASSRSGKVHPLQLPASMSQATSPSSTGFHVTHMLAMPLEVQYGKIGELLQGGMLFSCTRPTWMHAGEEHASKKLLILTRMHSVGQ